MQEEADPPRAEAMTGATAVPIPLAYATPDADGLPAFDPEAEAMIDAGYPPVALRRLYPKRRQASRYFAKSMTRRYAATAAPDVCHACGASPASRLASTLWTVNGVRSMELSNPADAVPCVLLFPLCTACAERWGRRLQRWRWLKWPRLMLSFSWIVYLLGLFVMRVLHLAIPGAVVACFIGGWLGLGLGAAGATKLVVRHATPKAVRAIRRKRFDYSGLIGIGERPAVVEAETAGDFEPADLL